MAAFKQNMPGCAACGCDTGDIIYPPGCTGCGIPGTLTLTWYYAGYNQNPCAALPGPGFPPLHEYGPLTSTLNYSGGSWVTPWTRSPCWVGNNGGFGLGAGAACCCLYHRIVWTCATAVLYFDFASDASGANLNACNSGARPPVTRQATSDNIVPLQCTPFFQSFGAVPDESAVGFGRSLMTRGVLTP